MRILKIPYALVAADYEASNYNIESSNPSSRSQRFSTAQHLATEILPVVPENPPLFTHCNPPWAPYNYTLWYNLIAQSQGLQEGQYHEVVIPGFLYEDMMRCHSAWVATGRIHNTIMTEMLEALESTKAGRKLASLLDGEKKWFMKLDQMSPKDSPMGGKLPSLTVRDVIMKLCTSMRAHSCLQREKEDAEKENREMKIKLVLNRWDEDMDDAREFRVFVPPSAAAAGAINDFSTAPKLEDFKISAISQYKWPFVFQTPWDYTLEETVSNVETGANAVLRDIITYTKEELTGAMRDLLLKHGFSFDIMLVQDGNVQLIEINPFGALSGCGASLFNWILDGKTLYGLEEAQFAVTLDEAAQ
jgi:hypothetical protein